MIALKILDLKKFMSAFLVRDLFDGYSLIESQIRTFCTHSIDGRLERSFFENKNAENPGGAATAESAAPQTVEYVRFRMVKPYVYNVIRGKHTPLYFKFVFFYPPEDVGDFLASHGLSSDASGIAGLCINLRYDGTQLLLTTGISRKGFSLDRSADEAWDSAVRALLDRQGISYEVI